MTCLLVLSLLLAAAPDSSATETADPSPSEAGETVVSAHRDAWRELDSDRSIDSVDERERHEQGAATLPDALRESAGVFVQSTNRGAGSPIIRGLIGPQNLLLVDGVRFNLSTWRTGPNQYLATFDPEAVERIEILRGPGSVLYGSDAMGGVIQLRTFAPEHAETPGWSARALTRFSTSDYGRQLAASVERRGTLSADAGLSWGQYDPLRAGGGERQPASGFGQLGWRGRLGLELGDWSLAAAYFGFMLNDAGRADAIGKGEVQYTDNLDHFAYLRARRDGEGPLHAELTVSWHRSREASDTYRCATGEGWDPSACSALEAELDSQKRMLDLVDAFGGSAILVARALDSRLQLRAGADGWLDSVASQGQKAGADGVFTELPRGNFSDGSIWMQGGLFAHARLVALRAAGWDLVANGGARLAAVSAMAPAVPGIGEVSYAYRGLVGSAGLELLSPGSLDLYSSWSQGLRAPNLQETTVLGDTGSSFEIPNPDLKPERASTLEVGAKGRFGPLFGRAAAYYSWIEGFIDVEEAQFGGQSEVDGKPVRRRVNRDQARLHGVELSLESRPWHGLSGSASASLVDGEVDAPAADGSITQTSPRRLPPVFGSFGARWAVVPRPVWVGLGTRWALAQHELHPGDRKDLRICEDPANPGKVLPGDSCQGTPGWIALDLRAGARLARGVDATLVLENLLDARYRLHGSGWDAPGRQLVVGIAGEI